MSDMINEIFERAFLERLDELEKEADYRDQLGGSSVLGKLAALTGEGENPYDAVHAKLAAGRFRGSKYAENASFADRAAHAGRAFRDYAANTSRAVQERAAKMTADTKRHVRRYRGRYGAGAGLAAGIGIGSALNSKKD
jgi:hypothetical protein